MISNTNKPIMEEQEDFKKKFSEIKYNFSKADHHFKLQEDKIEKIKKQREDQRSEEVTMAMQKIDAYKGKFSDLLKRVLILEVKMTEQSNKSISTSLQKRIYALIDEK
jgi:uncharacterized protein YihD (DUF1040 family)